MSFIEDPDNEIGGRSKNLDPYPAYVGVLDNVSDEELRVIFDRAENTSEAEVHGISLPIGVVSREIDRRYQATLQAEAEQNNKPEAEQLDLGLGVPQPRQSLLTVLNKLRENDEKAG